MPGPWGQGWRNAPAPAPTLNGDWAPFNRCPVDDPAMLAADGVHSLVACLGLSSPGGSIKVGALALPTPESDTQFGLVVENPEEGGEQVFKVVSPAGGTTTMAPIVIPNGLPALVCPTAYRQLRWICGGHPGGYSQLGNVSVSVEPAGEVPNFNLMFEVGSTLITEPVKIHLQNPVLGPHCYLGSNEEPIELHLQILTPITTFAGEGFMTDGTPVEGISSLVRLAVGGASVGDESFAVPGASGCGDWGRLDGAIDHNAGLPSAAGNNALRLNETSTYLGLPTNPEELAPNEGKTFSQDWHSAILGGHRHWH